MSIEEFSNEFDILVASYRRFKDFDSKEELDSIEFNEYEKSVYLTQAQEQLILSYYNGANSRLLGFETTEETRRYLAKLVKNSNKTVTNSTTYTNGYTADLPSDCWFIVGEIVKFSNDSTNPECVKNSIADVVPITLEEYYSIINNPFRNSNNKRVLRLDVKEDQVTLISKYKIANDGYIIHYLSKPNPIVLVNLPSGVTVDNVSTTQNCELHTALHRPILELAVQLALRSKNISLKNNQTSNN